MLKSAEKRMQSLKTLKLGTKGGRALKKGMKIKMLLSVS